MFEQVTWDIIGEALSTKPKIFQLWATKHACGFFTTGKMMQKYGYQDHAKCPCCQIEGLVEDTRHVLTCMDPRMRAGWKDKMGEFTEWVEDTASVPLIEALESTLYRADPLEDHHSLWPKEVLVAYTAQQEIGWQNVMEGRIATAWIHAADIYLHTIVATR